MKVYSDFIELVKEYNDLNSVGMLLSWDQETYMPPMGVKDRSQQVATLSKVAHNMITSKKMGSFIDELRSPDILDQLSIEQKAVIREIEWEYTRAVALPPEFVKELAKTESEGFSIWNKARQASDFSMFAPMLTKMVDMKRKEAEFVGYEDTPYDALLDQFEAGLRTSALTPLFAGLRDRLSVRVDKILASGITPDTSFTKNQFPLEAQRELNRQLAESIKFDFQRGRMDEAPHPFTAGSLNDTRITVRYYDNDPRPGIFSTLHEGGHALYEQGFPEEHYGTPLSQSVSLGVHESQSRMIENIVGRSKEFWQHWYPKMSKLFPSQMANHTADGFYAAINDVRPSLIRVESDEVTYNMHIILRFEIEKALISGEIEANDAPQVWNESMDKYLQVEVPNDANGVLQDVHWSSGLFGYFPTYTLGNLYSAQFYDTAQKDIPTLNEDIAKGDMSSILDWLRANIHQKGRLYRASDLMKNVTGNSPSEEYFIKYLDKKFGELYGF